MIKIEGIVKNNTKTGDINEGLWGIDISGEFYECGNFLAELDCVKDELTKTGDTKEGQKITIIID